MHMVQHFLKNLEAKGYMDDEGKIYPGIRRVGIPVFNSSGKLAAAIVLGAIAQLVSDEDMQKNVELSKALINSSIA